MPIRLALVIAAGMLLCGTGCQSLRLPLARDHFVRGQMLADQGDAEAALAELAEAVRQDPKLAVAHAAIGDIHRRRGDLDRARESYQTACSADPYAFRPHYNLGVTCQLLAQAATAVAKAEEFLREAVRVYLRAAAIEPDDFDTNQNLAACYFQLRKDDLAEQYCLAATRTDPRSAAARTNLAVIYDRQGRHFDAIREYKASLEIDERQPQLLLNLGAIYARQERYRMAINCFELAAKEDPNLAAAHEMTGSAHLRLQQFEQALAAYQKAAAADTASAAAWRGIGAAYMSQYVTDRSRADLRDKALEAWHRSLELRPDQPDLLRFIEKYRPKTAGPAL